MKGGVLVIFFSLSVATAANAQSPGQTQTPKQADQPTSHKDLVVTLPATLVLGISPPSLGGVQVPLYQDKSTKLYYVTPMLLPDWSALEKTIRTNCQSDTVGEQDVTMTLEFSRDSIRQEIAQRATERIGETITKEQILTYPYASIYVEMNARSGTGRFPRRQILVDPPLNSSQVKVQALRVSPPRSYTAQFSASCNELKAVLTTKDISGQFLAPFAEVAVNTFSVVYTDFVTSTQMSNIFRDEASKGAQTATSSSKAGGLGINIGGHFGSKSSASTGVITTKDTRTRSISANLLDDASAEFAKNVRMETWIEFGNANVTRDKVAEELLKFIFANSVPIDAQIKRIDAGNWSLIAGTESRSLTNDELQQVLEGVSKQKLDFSEKAEGEFKGFKGGADKKYAGSDDNNIKWKMEGAAWVPTNLRLYAVSSDRVSQSARAQVVDVLVKNKGMLAAPLEPVADHYLPNQDLIEIIKAQIGQAELQLKALINKTLLNVHNYDEAGVDGIDATAGVTGSRCLPGSFHYDMHTYKEGGNVKIGIRCRKFKAPQIP